MNRFQPVMEKIDWQKLADGLVPAVVQNSQNGSVLMMAWMNKQSLEQTIETGKVTFFSRSRQEIWVKGDTSGNFLDFVSMIVDCDGDTLLVQAIPAGPACHTGQETCFGSSVRSPFAFLGQLQNVIDQRAGADAETSYTASLLSGPFHRVAQKVGEEAIETILAATSRTEDDLIDESADLIYHLMVMLRAKDLSLDSIVGRLAERHTK